MQKKSLGKVTKITVAVILAVAVCLAGWMIFSGRLYVGLKDPSQGAFVSYQVCTDEDIDQYNKITKDASGHKTDKIRDLEKSIKSRKNYKQDSNCLYMLINFRITNQDPSKAREHIKELNELVNHGDSRISLRFDDLINPKNLLGYIDGIEKNNEEADNYNPDNE